MRKVYESKQNLRNICIFYLKIFEHLYLTLGRVVNNYFKKIALVSIKIEKIKNF